MPDRYYHTTLNLIYFNSRLEGDPILNRFLQAELEPQKHLSSFFCVLYIPLIRISEAPLQNNFHQGAFLLNWYRAKFCLGKMKLHVPYSEDAHDMVSHLLSSTQCWASLVFSLLLGIQEIDDFSVPG